MKRSIDRRSTIAMREPSTRALIVRTPIAAAVAALFALPVVAMAGPSGGQVVGGQASIHQSGQTTRIDQHSQRAIIDWRAFNVGANETVQFNQPSAQAAILNRVVGNDPSAIYGRINANGQVYLVNPNGILFGRSAQVNVGSLMATTANVSNADFMAGRMAFTQPGKPGATVRNEGSISVSEGGFVGLVGPGVSNAGVINARLGKVTLAGGDAFVIDLYGDKLVNLVVDPTLMPVLTDASGQPLSASVDQSGQIVAPGGKVTLTVETVKRLVDNVIHVSGEIRATSFETAQGVISLRGDANTVVSVAGGLDASSEQGPGGRIEVTGREVNLGSTAQVDASGASGGGSVSIGGDWQGKGVLANASTTRVEVGARIDASAKADGDGGTVVVWADGKTSFNGVVAARGGEQSGNGGRVEVSGRQHLSFDGSVDAAASNGAAGSLLLDPENIRIAATGDANLPGAGGGDSTIAAETVNQILRRGTSVTLQADRDLTVAAAVDGRAAYGGRGGGGLTLTAGNDIAFEANVLLRDGALNATAGNRVSSSTGTILYTGAAPLNLSGGSGVDVDRLVTNGAVDLRSTAGGVAVRNAIIGLGDPVTPTASLNVNASRDVVLNGALVSGATTIASSAGNVQLASSAPIRAGSVQVDGGVVSSIGGIDATGHISVTAREGMSLRSVVTPG
ncbi:MAG: filamentous hemagglutinin N-terminal domain-containing protein, partial [Patulibacter sp.]